MKTSIAMLAFALGVSGFAGEGFAQTTKPPSTAASATSTPATTKPSEVTKVETWTQQQWDTAKAEWAKDKTRWSACQKQSRAKKLDGRKSWSFLYSCMTG